MRIAMVSEHANPLAAVGGVDAGGQNVHVAALAAHLVGRGAEVTVFTRRDHPSSPGNVLAPDGYVVEHVPAGPPTEVPKDELLPHMPAFGRYLAMRWGEEDFDVAHAHFWMSGLAATAAAESVPIPVVQTFHALGTVKRRHQGRADTSPRSRIGLERQLCRRVDHVIATCADEVEELRLLGLDPARASVVPCGVDLERFTPGQSPPGGHGGRLLVVGRLVERKGVADVISALAALPQLELVVAGGPSADALAVDPEVRRLRALAEANGTAGRVHFLGQVSRDDMPGLIRTADVVVAVPWYEPFGIVPLEAMACGVPVVGSAVGGLLDTVLHGVTGELVPPRRPGRLADVLRRLMADPETRASYRAAGLERVRRRYGWPRVAEDTERVFSSVVRHSSARSGKVAR